MKTYKISVADSGSGYYAVISGTTEVDAVVNYALQHWGVKVLSITQPYADDAQKKSYTVEHTGRVVEYYYKQPLTKTVYTDRIQIIAELNNLLGSL